MNRFARRLWWKFSPSQILEKWMAFAFDRRHGTDTSSFVELKELDVAGDNKRHGERYQPSPVYSLRRLLRRLGIHYPDYAFVDFGSGKGRTLLVAGELPFRQVLGVEFSEELHRKTAQNIGRYPQRAAAHVESVHADATTFSLPADALVLYFFNPFSRPVLDKVLANIAASVAEQPRPVILIYLYLPGEHWLSSLQGFRLRETWRNYHVYDNLPQAVGTIDTAGMAGKAQAA